MNKKSIWISVGFHVALVIIGTVSFPWLKRDFEIPPPISIELAEIAPITQTTKVAPQPAPKKEEEPKEAAPKPPPAAKNTSNEAQVPVKKEPEPKKEEPKKKDTVLVDDAAPPEKKKTKQEEKKKEVKKEEPKKDFSSVLKNLSDSEDQPDTKPQLPDLKLDETAASDGAKAPLGAKMTMSEEDALRRQLEGCWNVPFGAKDAQDLRVEIFMVINQDRTLRDAKVVDQSRYNSDSFFRAAADSALRAVRNPSCSPFQLPADKYDVWKTVTVTFDPSQMF